MSRGVLVARRDYVETRAIWAALAEHERSAGLGTEIQDSFSYGTMRAIAFEPTAHPALHPENWRKLNAGIDVSVRQTRKGVLAIDVSPWAERCAVTTAERFVDFVAFPGHEMVRGRPTITIFEMALEDLQLELRYASANCDGAAVGMRRLVYLSYEHILQCLALHFDVRVQTALLSLGDDCRLLIRKLAAVENLVDVTQPWPAHIGWHSKYLSMCAAEGVAPDELFDFFQSALVPLGDSARLAVLRQYLGKPAAPARHRRAGRTANDTASQLLQAVTVVASPDTFPALVGHPSKRVEARLLQIAKGAHPFGMKAIAEQYCIEPEGVLCMLREHYPRVLLEVFVSPVEMRRELEAILTARLDVPRAVDELQQRILSKLGRAWAESTDDERRVRKQKLAKVGGFASFEKLKQWAQEHAPIMMFWLNSL